MSVEANLNFEGATDEIERAFTHGLNLAAEALLDYSIPLTPKIEGTLRLTGHAIHATNADEGSAVRFDGPQAGRLHEHPEYNFSEPGTGAKFLENPAMEHKDELTRIVATAVKNGDPHVGS